MRSTRPGKCRGEGAPQLRAYKKTGDDFLMGFIQQGAGHGHLGALSIAYQPVCLSQLHCRTGSPLVAPVVMATRSAKRRNLWPSTNTRKPLRCHARDSRVWNCARNVLRRGAAPTVFWRCHLRSVPPGAPKTSRICEGLGSWALAAPGPGHRRATGPCFRENAGPGTTAARPR